MSIPKRRKVAQQEEFHAHKPSVDETVAAVLKSAEKANSIVDLLAQLEQASTDPSRARVDVIQGMDRCWTLQCA